MTNKDMAYKIILTFKRTVYSGNFEDQCFPVEKNYWEGKSQAFSNGFSNFPECTAHLK